MIGITKANKDLNIMLDDTMDLMLLIKKQSKTVSRGHVACNEEIAQATKTVALLPALVDIIAVELTKVLQESQL